MIFDQQEYSDWDFLKLVVDASWISQPGSILARKVIEKIGMLDEKLDFQMDLDLWMRAGLHFPFGHIPKPVARFRIHSQSKTTLRKSVAAKEIIYIYKKFFNNTDLPTEIQKIRGQAFASANLYSARRYLASGNWRDALSRLWKAVEYSKYSFFRIEFWKSFFKILFIRVAYFFNHIRKKN
jgi:hypothetical protein